MYSHLKRKMTKEEGEEEKEEGESGEGEGVESMGRREKEREGTQNS